MIPKHQLDHLPFRLDRNFSRALFYVFFSSSFLNRDKASTGTKRSVDSVASANGIRYYPNDFFSFFTFLVLFLDLPFLFYGIFYSFLWYYGCCPFLFIYYFFCQLSLLIFLLTAMFCPFPFSITLGKICKPICFECKCSMFVRCIWMGAYLEKGWI